MNKPKMLFGILALALFAASCSYANTEPTEFACAYGGGPMESKAQKGDNPIPPSSGRDFIGVFDTIVYLPSDVRNYIIDLNPGVGDVPNIDFIQSPTKDKIEMNYELNARFRINTDKGCEFWEETGKRFDIDTSEGWQDFLEQNLRPIIENSLKEQSQQFNWEDIWGNIAQEDGTPTWTVIQGNLGQSLVDKVNASLGDDYLCGVTWKSGSEACPPFEVLIKSAVPEDESLTNRYAEIQGEQAETERVREVKARDLEAAELDAKTDLARAEAQIAVSEANREKAIIDAEADAALCEQLESIGVDCTMYIAAQNGQTEFWFTDGSSNGPVITQGG